MLRPYLTKDLEKALTDTTDFVNNISHEVRAPIHGIGMLSKGLVENWNQLDDETAYNLAVKISTNAQRLLDLANDILDLSKAKYDGIDLNSEKASLTGLIQDMIDECQDLYLFGKDVKIKFEHEEEIKTLLDSQKITQVLRNLLTNAIKFTNHGTVTISAKHDKGYIKVSVSDEGIGIPSEELDSIFQLFTQSSRTKGKISGAGLGLTIAQKIILAHGGKIWAENNTAKGTTFSFTLPLSKKLLSEQPKNDGFFKVPSSKANVMVVDNEETCLLSLKMLAYNTHYNISTYINPLEALKFLEKNPDSVDMILVDIMMPEMSGVEFLRAINDNPNTTHIPVAIQSGTSDEDVVDMVLRSGAAAFIRKPYSRENIVESIEKALAKKNVVA